MSNPAASTGDHDKEVARGAPPRGLGKRGRAVPLGIGLGLLLSLAAVVGYAWMGRSGAAQLTQAEYEAAWSRWQSRGPASYELDLELTGNRPGTIHVEVLQGTVTRMTRDGVEPRQRRTWDYWSVPGQFDTIAEELQMAQDPAQSFKTPAASAMVIRAEFDPEFGYPKKYDRAVLGADFEVHWVVTRFKALDDHSADLSPAAGRD